MGCIDTELQIKMTQTKFPLFSRKYMGFIDSELQIKMVKSKFPLFSRKVYGIH